MRQELYLQFSKRLKCKWLSLFLTNVLYFLICCRYILKKILRKKKIAVMSTENAKSIIDNVYPRHINNLDFSNPKINKDLDLSIVIPVYNYADKLKNNMDSYLNQVTEYNYELIFVNDGSTDDSLKVLNEYSGNSKVKIIDKDNNGAGAARNSGINIASGKYIAFIDCDDSINENMVDRLLTEAYTNNCDIVICAHNLIRIKDEQVISVLPSIYSKKNLLNYKNNDQIMNYPGFPWGKVYKRELFNNVRFPENYWYEDAIIHFLLFTQCRTYSYLEEPMYNYYWHDRNISHIVSGSNSIKTIDRYWLLIEILDQYKHNDFPIDNCLYTLVLKHISAYYYKEIRLLDDDLVQALFVLAKQLIDEYKPKDKVKLPYMLRQVEKAFEKNDMSLWALSSCNQ